MATLQERIVEHDKYFCSLMDAIPKNLYFPIEHNEEAREMFFKNKSGKKAPDHKGKERAIAIKLKRERFDVELQKTNVEQQIQNAKDGADPSSEKRATGAGRKRTLGESISKSLVPTVPSNASEQDGQRSSSIEDLKLRLQQKINQHKLKRKADSVDNAENLRKKAKTKFKKTEKGQRVQPTTTKKTPNGVASSAEIPENGKMPPAAEASDVLDLRYGTLLVGEDKSAKHKKKKPQLKHLLEKADANKQRLEELKKESATAANKEMMKRAILQAHGEKIKDDPTMLRKTLKKKEKSKKKHSAEWKQRKKDLNTTMVAESKKKAMSRPGFEGKAKTFLNAGPKGKAEGPKGKAEGPKTKLFK